MYELVRRCLDENDPDSWTELWLLYFEVVEGPVRRLMLDHYSYQDSEDVVMAITVDLMGGDHQKLRTFRGESRGELCRWFLQVAIRTALKCIDANRRRARQLRQYAAESARHSPGPTEAEVRLTIAELEQAAAAIASDVTDKDIARLRILAGLETVDEPPAERTVRHWKKELIPRVSRSLATRDV